MSDADRHLGRGLAFPLRPAPGLSWLGGIAKVEQSIRLILETEPGERLMRPAFGCGLRRYLMAPNTAETRALIQRSVRQAIERWEPRVELLRIEVVPAPAEPSRIDVHIAYITVRDNRPGNLVHPFYLE